MADITIEKQIKELEARTRLAENVIRRVYANAERLERQLARAKEGLLNATKLSIPWKELQQTLDDIEAMEVEGR